MNFLPVGHTHEDIDQLFSKIGDEVKRSGSESIPGIYVLFYLSGANSNIQLQAHGHCSKKQILNVYMYM